MTVVSFLTYTHMAFLPLASDPVPFSGKLLNEANMKIAPLYKKVRPTLNLDLILFPACRIFWFPIKMF